MEIDVDKVLPKWLADRVAPTPKLDANDEGQVPPPPPPTDVDKIEAGEEVSAPRFTDIFKETGDPTLKSATRFTDYLSVEENKRKATRAAIIALLVLLFAGIIFIGYLASRPAKPTPTPATTATATQPPIDAQWDAGTIENPVTKALPDQPAPAALGVRADVTDTAITFSSGYTLNLKEAKATSGQEACTVTQPTDFCYSGTITAGKAEGRIYTLRDTVHSRLFDGAAGWKATTKENAILAGTLNIITDSTGSRTPAVVIATGDGAGVMITTNSDQAAQAIMNTITVTKM